MRPKLGMNAGAGFGGNNPGEGVYHQAVTAHYAEHPGRAATDRAVAEEEGRDHGVDLGNVEEVYNFARYLEHGFDLLPEQGRPQLNVARLRADPARRR